MLVHAAPLENGLHRVPTRAASSPAGAVAGSPAVQRLAETGRALNARPEVVAQRALAERLSGSSAAGGRPSTNRTGLPDGLKAGVEALSGISLGDVRVHRNSSKPAQLQAHAYAQGSDIHLAPGQERHLPHEAWHVVQQRQGRVRPTLQLERGVPVNDDAGLEREADVMGARAASGGIGGEGAYRVAAAGGGTTVVQRKLGFEFETAWKASKDGHFLNKGAKVGTGSHPGYKVESDDDGAIEFIIDPPLEISRYLLGNEAVQGEIDAIFDNMDGYVAGLVAAREHHKTQVVEEEDDESRLEDDEFRLEDDDNVFAVDADDGSSDDADEPPEPEFEYDQFPLSEATGIAEDGVFGVLPQGGEVRANPQITAGMTLGQLARLPQSLVERPLASELRTQAISARPQAFLARMDGAAYHAAGLDLDALGGSVSDDLKGLVALAASYLAGGDHALLPYPKAATDGFILSRTDFVGLFHQLPLREKRYFHKNPAVWVNLVMRVAQLQGSADDRVFRAGLIDNLGQVDQNFGPTRRAWLRGILTERSDLMSFAADEEYEGMGRLGLKTEMVPDPTAPGGIAQGGIFEIRAGQTQSLDYPEWRPFVKDVAGFYLHAQGDSVLSDLEHNKRLSQSKPVFG